MFIVSEAVRQVPEDVVRQIREQRADLQAYGGQMSEIPTNGSTVPDDGPQGNEVPADAFSPVVDPGLVPDTGVTTPEEKRARRDPEETGS